MAPAVVPSSAMTTSMVCHAVTWTRRAISSRMGPRSSSPAAATPPPSTHPVGCHQHDRVGDADAQVSTGLGQPGDGARVASTGRRDRLLDRVRAADLRDLLRPAERLDAAAIAAVAEWTIRVDDLVADLAGRALVALEHLTVDRDDTPDAGAQCQADHRADTPARTKSQLREPEGPGVVDERRRQPQRRRHGTCDRHAPPATGHVDQELRGTGRRVVQAGHADTHRPDARDARR